MLLLIISVAVTMFLLATAVMLMFGGKEVVDERLAEISSGRDIRIADEPHFGLAGLAGGVTAFLKPLRDLITANDEDLVFRLALAGYRKPEHAEIYTAAKMLLPVVAILAASFAGSNAIVFGLIGGAVGFFGPDLFVTQMAKRRQDRIRHALPDALDLLVICMEAGLGIDQALVRVGEEVRITCPELADEFLIINREQRAGKPRLDAWRSMAARLDIDYVREFVGMLVQTERFGTPIAQALGNFADTLRMHRMHAVEEAAAKTTIKLLFPLVLCIFPSLFVVTLIPAVLHIGRALEEFLK